MKMTEQEQQRREKEVFYKKSDFAYYDLDFTQQHQTLCDQYLLGQLTDQAFNEAFYQINRSK